MSNPAWEVQKKKTLCQEICSGVYFFLLRIRICEWAIGLTCKEKNEKSEMCRKNIIVCSFDVSYAVIVIFSQQPLRQEVKHHCKKITFMAWPMEYFIVKVLSKQPAANFKLFFTVHSFFRSPSSTKLPYDNGSSLTFRLFSIVSCVGERKRNLAAQQQCVSLGNHLRFFSLHTWLEGKNKSNGNHHYRPTRSNNSFTLSCYTPMPIHSQYCYKN